MLQKLRHFTRLFITGGDWANALPAESRRNLYRYWFDGLFAAASDTVPVNYLTLYLLAMGATGAQVGWFSSLSSLAAAVALLPGAFIVEKYGRRKEVAVVFGGLLARILLLTMALAPLPLSGQPLIWLVITLGTLRSAAGNLAFPAWMSLTGDIVPMEGRGRYFGSRNFVMVIAGIVVTYLIGELITRVESLQGYQLALGLSFLTGLVSTWFFWSIKDSAGEQPVQSEMKLSVAEIWQGFRASPFFLQFCIATAVWNFSLNVAGPFFNVYMAQDLSFTAAMIGITAIATNVTRLLTQRKLGELADRWGAGRLQMMSMFLIPFLPIAWIFARELWHVVVINSFGGVFWGAFELASFNFLLVFMPENMRARYSAIFQVVVTISLAGGAALGGALIDSAWGYTGVFITSSLGRFAAAFMFLALMRKVRPGQRFWAYPLHALVCATSRPCNSPGARRPRWAGRRDRVHPSPSRLPPGLTGVSSNLVSLPSQRFCGQLACGAGSFTPAHPGTPGKAAPRSPGLLWDNKAVLFRFPSPRRCQDAPRAYRRSRTVSGTCRR